MRLINADKLSQKIETMYLGNDTKDSHRVCAETEDTMIGKFQVIDTIFEMPTVFEIPDNATNGDIFETLFNVKEVRKYRTRVVAWTLFNGHIEPLDFPLGWWNAPSLYKKGEDK